MVEMPKTYEFCDRYEKTLADIPPEYRIHPNTKLVLDIKHAKIWMQWSLEKPSRDDIADCAIYVKKRLLEEHGINISIDKLSETED